MTCPVRPRWYPRFRRRGAGGGRWGGRPCRTANVIVGRGASERCARRAGNGKPGSGTGARFAPIATTRSASSATALRSTASGRAGSGTGRPRPSCGRRLRRGNSLPAACWTPDRSRIGSGCSSTCSARLPSRRDGSPVGPTSNASQDLSIDQIATRAGAPGRSRGARRGEGRGGGELSRKCQSSRLAHGSTCQPIRARAGDPRGNRRDQ